jgi:cytochrome c
VADAEDGTSAQQPDLIGFRTLVSAAWKTGDGRAAQTEPGFALMKQSDCFNCHMVDQPLVGPKLLDVANKYRGQAGAENATVQRVINGSTGVWGQVGMLPHPQHTEDEVHQMVQWIYSLQPGKDAPGLLRGITGAVPIPKGDFSACTLEAVYTDAGAPPVGSLNGHATVTLRSRRLEAENADEIKGPKNMDNGGASGKHVVGSIGDKNYLRFANLNLADSSAVKFRVASGGSGGEIELHAGSLSGALLAEVEVKPTGDWGKYFDLKAPLSNAPAGRTDLYVVFTNPGKGGLMNLDYLQLEPK